MPILRTAQCDLCDKSETEKMPNSGWPGWCIINGIAAVKPEEGVPLTDENMSMTLCPSHKNAVARFIGTLQKENK